MQPKFPLYIVSKGRWDVRKEKFKRTQPDNLHAPHTALALEEQGAFYRIIVEEQEYDEYAKVIDPKKILLLDKGYQRDYDTADDLDDAVSKGAGPARNFAWEHSMAEGHEWHWVMDDNITHFYRWNKNQKIIVRDGAFWRAMEDFCLRYKNVAMAGPHYHMFMPRKVKRPPFILNTRIYSCNLIRNDIPYRWRARLNEDTDLSLRMLKDGWCTVQFHAFLQGKMATQHVIGGNTREFYADEGTLHKSQILIKLHPDVSRLAWRYGRWHHYVDYSPFEKNRLVRKDRQVKKGINEYGLVLKKSATKESILNETDKIHLPNYLSVCSRYAEIDTDRAFDLTINRFRQYRYVYNAHGKRQKGEEVSAEDIVELTKLEIEWRESLKNGMPNRDVYNSPHYFCELWRYWVNHSSKYLKTIQDSKSLVDHSVIDDMKGVGTVMDLGCGVGYTTAALKEMFPEADIVGTNLASTCQHRMATNIGSERGFSVADSHMNGSADMIFASEYFQHIQAPIEQLIDILENGNPHYLLIANTFCQPSIGGFNTYTHKGNEYSGRQITRLFNNALKSYGYEKQKTKCWNNRPDYWKRVAA